MVQTTNAFGREGGEGIAANRQVIQAAFSDEVLVDGANSSVIELDPETSIALRVKEHLKPAAIPLADVRDDIVVQLQRSLAAETARTQGEQLLAELRDGKQPDGQWQPVEAAARSQEGVAPALLQAVFRMPRPQQQDKPNYTGVALGNGDYVVVRLNGVNEPETALSDEEKLNYRRFLASRIGQQDFAAYRQKQQAAAKIERF